MLETLRGWKENLTNGKPGSMLSSFYFEAQRDVKEMDTSGL